MEFIYDNLLLLLAATVAMILLGIVFPLIIGVIVDMMPDGRK